MPVWYRVLVAARWLKVAPWELEAVPVTWLQEAEAAMQIEAEQADAERAKAKGR